MTRRWLASTFHPPFVYPNPRLLTHSLTPLSLNPRYSSRVSNPDAAPARVSYVAFGVRLVRRHPSPAPAGIWNRAAQGPSCDCRRRHHTPAGAGDSTAPRVVAEAHRRRGRGGIRGGRVAARRDGGGAAAPLSPGAQCDVATRHVRWANTHRDTRHEIRKTQRNRTERNATRRDAAGSYPRLLCRSRLRFAHFLAWRASSESSASSPRRAAFHLRRATE